MHIGKAIAGNVLAGSLGRIINALTPLLLVPLMIRTWGLHQYGEWLILTAIPTYMMLSPDFGLMNAVVNQMAKATAEGKRKEAITLYRTSWLILTVMAVCFALIGIAVASWVNWKPFGVTLLSKNAAGIISLSLVQIFLGQQLFLLTGIYRSARRNPRCGLLGSIGYAFYLLVGCTILILKGGPMVFVSANIVARIVFLGVFLFDIRRIMPDFTLSLRGVSVNAIRPYIVPGLGHATMPLVNALQSEGMVLVLGAILGPVSVAVFQTTRTAVNGAKSLSGLFASAVGVEIPALIGEGRMSAVRRLLVLNIQTTIAAVICWLSLLGVFGEPIFHLWLRSRAVYSASLTLLMLISMFPFALGSSFSLILQATNQIHRAVVLLLPAALASLIVSAVSCRLLGVNGAGLGLIVFETLTLLVMCYITSKYTGVQLRATLAAVFSKQSLAMGCDSITSTLRSTGSRLSRTV